MSNANPIWIYCCHERKLLLLDPKIKRLLHHLAAIFYIFFFHPTQCCCCCLSYHHRSVSYIWNHFFILPCFCFRCRDWPCQVDAKIGRHRFHVKVKCKKSKKSKRILFINKSKRVFCTSVLAPPKKMHHDLPSGFLPPTNEDDEKFNLALRHQKRPARKKDASLTMTTNEGWRRLLRKKLLRGVKEEKSDL